MTTKTFHVDKITTTCFRFEVVAEKPDEAIEKVMNDDDDVRFMYDMNDQVFFNVSLEDGTIVYEETPY